MANALGRGVPIISANYLRDFLECIKSQQTLPDVRDYVPCLKEANLNLISSSLAVNFERRTVFKNKRLLFASTDQLLKYKIAIGYASGKAEVFKSQILDKNCDIMILASSGIDQTKEWKMGLEKYKKWDMIPVQESQIALAILHASCDNFCNPFKKYRVLGTPSSSQHSRPPTLAQETQSAPLQSECCK